MSQEEISHSIPIPPQIQTQSGPIRRGSVKGRYDELAEEQKKIDAEKVKKIKESRGKMEKTGSIKNIWEETVAQHKDHEIKKFEETKESTMSGFRGIGNENHVNQLISQFNKIFVQKRLAGEKFMSRYKQLREKTLQNQIIYLNIENCPEIIASTAYCIDLTNNPYAQNIRDEAVDNQVFPEIGLFGEGDNLPPIEVISQIHLTDDGKILMPLRMDVLPANVNEANSYGHQKIIVYLPLVGTSTAADRTVGQAILEFDFQLSPSSGWEEFNRRAEQLQANVLRSQSSFSSVSSSQEENENTTENLKTEENQVSLSAPDSPCGSEPLILSHESLEIASTPETKQDILNPPDIQIEDVIVEVSPAVPDPVTISEIEQSSHDEGYLLLSPASSAEQDSPICDSLPAPLESFVLPSQPVAGPIQLSSTSPITSLLYHESHEHYLVPTSNLDPMSHLNEFSCFQCAKNTSQLEFVCPDCRIFICSGCCRKGNGIRASIQSHSLELNSEILFKPGFSSLLPESHPLVNQIGRFLRDHPIPILIEGHINAVQSTGNILNDSSKLLKVYEPNCNGQTLSLRRAEKVLLYLQQSFGIDRKLLRAKGCGGQQPLTRNKEELNKNR